MVSKLKKINKHYKYRTDDAGTTLQSCFQRTVLMILMFNLFFAVNVFALNDLKCWWTHSTVKIFPDDPVPKKLPEQILISAAQNEYEAFQLVLQNRRFTRNVAISVLPFEKNGISCHAIQIEVAHVEFVTIQQPSDSSGRTGEWPDPLPPYASPFNLSANRNYPLWISTYIPPGTPAGTYQSQVIVRYENNSISIPVKLVVWDFQLPQQPTLRSGFGLSAKLIAAYHNLSINASEMDSVFDKYLLNFRQHRVCPYNPMRLHPIVTYLDSGKMSAASELARYPKVVLETQKFDQVARRYLDDFGFNAFRLPLEGVPKGSFHSRRPGIFKGFSEETPAYQVLFPQYLKQITAHLAENNWLEKAYVYWFDEPQEKDYDFVTAANRQFRKMAPGLKIFLTEEPQPELAQTVDIWCLAVQYFDPKAVAQAQARGEEVWWYLCTNPKSPYVTLFIDAAAINLRMWLWMTWKYRLQGILVWQSVYWNSETAFGLEKLQNPWRDPMSYLTGYGVPSGEKRAWGNGDGRFLYPPNRDVNASKKKYLTSPVNSIRWELLREGLEDYEYFNLLQQNLILLEQTGREQEVDLSLRELTRIPPEIITDLTHFTKEPGQLLAYRQRLAEAIIRTGKLIAQK